MKKIISIALMLIAGGWMMNAVADDVGASVTSTANNGSQKQVTQKANLKLQLAPPSSGAVNGMAAEGG